MISDARRIFCWGQSGSRSAWRVLAVAIAVGAASMLSCTEDEGSSSDTTSGGAAGSTSSAGGSSAAGASSSSGGAVTAGSGGTSAVAGSAGSSTTGGASTAGSSGTSAGSAGSSAGAAGSSGSADPTCDDGVWDGSTTPVPLTLSGNTFAHDPTMIEADGVFYRYWTGNDIPMAKSTNLTNWSNGTSVYTSGYPSWVSTWLGGVSGETFNFPWAPDASHWNGLYHLYSAFSAKFGDNISCITHLTTSDPGAFGWTDHGPVICTEGNENYNAIDPDVALDADGTPWLSFGSFWDGIELVELNADGTRADDNMTQIAWASQIEAPVLFYRCGYYYLFVSWGLCCPGENRTVSQLTYRVAVGRSESITGPYVDRDGTQMVDGGGTIVVQGDGVTWQAAGHSDVIATGGKIYHLYHAYRKSDGGAELRIVEMPFDEDGWPVPAGP